MAYPFLGLPTAILAVVRARFCQPSIYIGTYVPMLGRCQIYRSKKQLAVLLSYSGNAATISKTYCIRFPVNISPNRRLRFSIYAQIKKSINTLESHH